MQPTVLIATTSWWAFPARLAIAFDSAGYRVEAICPAHQPLLKTRAVARSYRYCALDPASALADAIDRADPVLIVPCDDVAVSHLHALHAGTGRRSAAAVIERSLGNPGSHTAAERRSEIIRLARDAGIRAPEMLPVTSVDSLRREFARLGSPTVLKVDGSWGGFGVAIVDTPHQAELVFRQLSRPQSGIRAIKRLMVNGDPFALRPWMLGNRPTVNLQAFVTGRPANAAVACWEGEVLAHIEVEVLRSRTTLGASTIVQVIDNPEMVEAAQILVRRLGLSGFCGFDFMIESGTGAAHLIEMNTRATPLTHLALGPGRDPVSALTARLGGKHLSTALAVTQNDIIAFFPQAWHHDPHSELLRSSYHDVPWEDPALMRELIELPWTDRGRLVRLAARIRAVGAALRRVLRAVWQNRVPQLGGTPLSDPGHGALGPPTLPRPPQ